MNDHIHTIPVLDALRAPCHCPFCEMYKKLDTDAVDFIMGPAYMDETIRPETDKAGFCAEHLQKLFAAQNRLGMAMLMHTHLRHFRNNLEKASGSFSNEKKSEGVAGFFKNNFASKSTSSEKSAIGKTVALIEAQQSKCYCCERIDTTFARYMDTFFYLWKKEREMIDLVKSVPGFCITHYGAMLQAAETILSQSKLDEFLKIVVPLQQRAMEKMDEDLDWFIQKFDYRNANAPWKDSKDAVPRAMAMLKGIEE